MRQQLIGTHPFTPFFWLMTLPEKRRKAIWENTGMVVEEYNVGSNEMWRSRMKGREAVMRGAGGKVEKRRNSTLRKNFDYNTGSRVERDWLVECEYLPGYWLLSRSWPPLTVNPNPGKLPPEDQAALSSWLSIRPCVDTSLLPLNINTLPPRSSPPKGQPTATSKGWHTHKHTHTHTRMF